MTAAQRKALEGAVLPFRVRTPRGFSAICRSERDRRLIIMRLRRKPTGGGVLIEYDFEGSA